VIPGGKVFVYSGILPTAQTDDGLAAILGHEIAHNLARHQAESMSRAAIILTPLTAALVLLDAMYGFGYGPGRFLGNIAMEFGLARPASRVQESEADFIGLMMMAKSCYDPYAAVGVWQRMEEGEKQEIPQWLSTHPSVSGYSFWEVPLEVANRRRRILIGLRRCKNGYRRQMMQELKADVLLRWDIVKISIKR
jgi:predicted Zn-dependent protease